MPLVAICAEYVYVHSRRDISEVAAGEKNLKFTTLHTLVRA